jgi:hypothetical protein
MSNTMTKSSPAKVASRKARTAKPSSKRTRKSKTAPKVVAEKVRGAHRPATRKVSADRLRDTWNTTEMVDQFPGTQVPKTFRVLAERNEANARELYGGSKNTLQAVLDSWNRRFIDLAERNMNTSFDLAMGLVGARNLAEVIELQATYWQKLLGDVPSERRAR